MLWRICWGVKPARSCSERVTVAIRPSLYQKHEPGVTPLTPHRANFTCCRAQFAKKPDIIARPGSAAWTLDSPMAQAGHPDDQQEEPDAAPEHKPERRGWHT